MFSSVHGFVCPLLRRIGGFPLRTAAMYQMQCLKSRKEIDTGGQLGIIKKSPVRSVCFTVNAVSLMRQDNISGDKQKQPTRSRGLYDQRSRDADMKEISRTNHHQDGRKDLEPGRWLRGKRCLHSSLTSGTKSTCWVKSCGVGAPSLSVPSSFELRGRVVLALFS